VRRTVATLLAVASPLLLTTPVSASDDRLPVPVQQVMPAVPAPASTPVAIPALPVPAAAAPALTPPAAPTPVRHAVKAVRAKAPASVTDLNDAAYAARLQAELCRARQIFCGLDRSGRYPAS
jgi:hypothetical protein